MTPHSIEYDDDDDFDDPIEGSWDDDREDYDADDESETIECSSCGTEVYEDALQCPICNEYVTARSRPFAKRPILFYVAIVLSGVALLRIVFS